MRRAALGALLGLLPVPGAAQEVAWEGGLSMATGTYLFTQRTTGWMLTNGVAVAAGPVSVRISWPLLLQNSALVTGSGSTWIPSGGPYSSMVADSGAARGSGRGGGGGGGGGGGMQGSLDVPLTAVTDYTAALGDPTARASLRIGSPARSLTLHGAAKAPLADTASFGTGRWDFSAGAALTYVLGTSGFLGADLSWWHLGDLPELDFQDPVWGMVSGGATLGGGWAGLVSVSGGTSALTGYDGPWSMSAGLSRLMGTTMVGVSAAVGLTDTAPQLSLALSWRVAL